MNDTILVPVDFSEYSLQAAQLAMNMGGRLQKNIVFLHVTDNLKLRIGERVDLFQSQLAAWIGQGKASDAPFSLEIRAGIPEEQIKRYMQRHDPWMVVMGTRGKAKKIKDLVGSVTAEVLDGATIPVLAIPEQYTWQNLRAVKRVSYATSFTSDEGKFIRLLAEMLPQGHLETLSFVHFRKAQDPCGTDDRKSVSDIVAEYFPNVNCEFRYEEFKDGFEEDFSEFLAQDPSELVVIKNSHRNVIRRTIHGGLAKRLAYDAEKPILVL